MRQAQCERPVEFVALAALAENLDALSLGFTPFLKKGSSVETVVCFWRYTVTTVVEGSGTGLSGACTACVVGVMSQCFRIIFVRVCLCARARARVFHNNVVTDQHAAPPPPLTAEGPCSGPEREPGGEPHRHRDQRDRHERQPPRVHPSDLERLRPRGLQTR